MGRSYQHRQMLAPANADSEQKVAALTENEARQLVEQTLADRIGQAWQLRAMSHGWIVEFDHEGKTGEALFFVEAATGELLAFPSALPPSALEERFETARECAWAVARAATAELTGRQV
jgi:hypothetical protein